MPSARSNWTFLAFDLGAESGRAILGRLRSDHMTVEEIHRFPNQPVFYNGGLHWDAPRLWHEMQTALRWVAAHGVGQLDSTGVDTWGVDYALLGDNGALLGNPFHYRDGRTEGVMQRVQASLGAERIYRTTGIQFLPFNTLYQLSAAALTTPDLLATARSLVTMPDLFHFWMTGRIACEYTNASTTQFLDVHTRKWAVDLLRDAGIPTHFLAPLIEPGEVLGQLRTDPGAPSGALARTVVIAPACHDTGSAFASVYSGEKIALLSSGTWSLLGVEWPRPVVTDDAYRLNFTNEGGVNGTVRLLKNITGMWLLESCRRAWQARGEDYSHGQLAAMAAGEKPLQHLLDPDDPTFALPQDMTAAIAAFCARTGQPSPQTPGAFTRAILESLALKYRAVLESLERVAGAKFEEIRIVGGGSQNETLNQFTADATCRRVLAGPAEATALGNLAMQMVGAGAVASLADARDLIAQSFPARVFEPNNSARWENAFANLQKILAAR